MWLRGLTAVLCATMLWTSSAHAQTAVGSSAAGPDWTPESRHGSLTVWRVIATGPVRTASIASLSPEVKSQTSGSFGQTAGSFGQSAGNTGQTAGSLGQNAGSFGQTAGSFGQSAGSLGVSTGDLANAAAASNGTSATAAKHDAAWDRFIQDAPRGLDVSYEEVGTDELAARLDAANGKAEAPDILIGSPLPQSWSRQDQGLVRKYGLVTLGVVGLIAQTETPEYLFTRPDASILKRAPHPRSARVFMLWFLDRNGDSGDERISNAMALPIAVAKSAAMNVLYGGEIGAAADKEMAVFNSQSAQETALRAYSPGVLDGLKIEIEAIGGAANERFAVVELRAVMEGYVAFGVAHAVVVLRVDSTGRWHVLQLTPNLAPEQQRVAVQSLAGYGEPVKRETVAQMLRVALAAPVDGDNRSPVPELWWDNGGTGTLEIVEWQRSAARSWTSSNMYFVPGDAGHLRTRTTGRFASAAGQYRWRVWSLGTGGAVAISSWRSVNILPH